MNIAMRVRLGAVAAGVLILVAGCGEKAQVVQYQDGKYAGKTDSRPWDSDPKASLYTSSRWTPGDKTSWEQAVMVRNQRQNEYNRVP